MIRRCLLEIPCLGGSMISLSFELRPNTTLEDCDFANCNFSKTAGVGVGVVWLGV